MSAWRSDTETTPEVGGQVEATVRPTPQKRAKEYCKLLGDGREKL